jgi:hypothetical protein
VNTKVVSGDVPVALRKLKAEDGPDMIVWGSGTLIQTLLREQLVDRMHVWIHPVTIGTGKRLFANGTHSGTWNLVKSRVGDAGVIIATYEPASTLVTGTIVRSRRSNRPMRMASTTCRADAPIAAGAYNAHSLVRWPRPLFLASFVRLQRLPYTRLEVFGGSVAKCCEV